MKTKIILDTPSGESLRFHFEEMADDPYVGRYQKTMSDAEWVDHMVARMDERLAHDIPSTVIYQGSSIVGFARSSPLGHQCIPANMKPNDDFWKFGNFYVLKAFRGKGFGKQALEFFLDKRDGKVFYFAKRENVASNAVARSVGLHWLHDYLQNAKSPQGDPCNKGVVIRTMNTTYAHVYCGIIPAENLLKNPALVDHSLYENRK